MSLEALVHATEGVAYCLLFEAGSGRELARIAGPAARTGDGSHGAAIAMWAKDTTSRLEPVGLCPQDAVAVVESSAGQLLVQRLADGRLLALGFAPETPKGLVRLKATRILQAARDHRGPTAQSPARSSTTAAPVAPTPPPAVPAEPAAAPAAPPPSPAPAPSPVFDDRLQALLDGSEQPRLMLARVSVRSGVDLDRLRSRDGWTPEETSRIETAVRALQRDPPAR